MDDRLQVLILNIEQKTKNILKEYIRKSSEVRWIFQKY